MRVDRIAVPRRAEDATGPEPAKRPDGSAWVAIIPALLTLLVVLDQIQRPSLWRDEGATLAAVHRSLPQLVRMLGHVDVVHGAYYLFMWFEVRLAGTSTLALRFPSAVAMAVAAGFITVLGRRLVSTRAGLAAGLVFAVLPSVSWYGQNARSYAMVAALATVASYLLVEAMAAGPRRRRRWLAGYGVILAALGLGNIFALLLIPAHALTLAEWNRRARAIPASDPPAAAGERALVRGWLIASAAAVAAVSPVIVISLGQRDQVSWLNRTHPHIFALRQALGSAALADLILLVIAATLAVSALRRRMRTDWPPGLVALSLPWLMLPPTVLLTASAIHPVYSLRYIVFCIPAAALLAGAGLASLGWAGGVASLALIALAAAPGQVDLRRAGGHGSNLRHLSHILALHSRPGDAVLFAGRNTREYQWAYPAGYLHLRDVGLGQTAVQSATLLGTDAPAAVIRQRLTTGSRLWVIETIPERGHVPVLDGLRFRVVQRYSVNQIWLVLYTRAPGPAG
jgi:mannosyltransferase